MGVIDRFERRLDRIVNGAFARTFKSEVEPVEVAAALQRECDDRAAIVDPRPHDGAQRLHRRARRSTTTNACRCTPSRWMPSSSSMVREHADEQGYAFVGPVEVGLRAGRGPGHRAVPDPQRGARRPCVDRPGAADGPGPRRGVAARARDRRARPSALTHRHTVLGRGADADLRLDDPGISRRHARDRAVRPAPGERPRLHQRHLARRRAGPVRASCTTARGSASARSPSSSGSAG